MADDWGAMPGDSNQPNAGLSGAPSPQPTPDSFGAMPGDAWTDQTAKSLEAPSWNWRDMLMRGVPAGAEDAGAKIAGAPGDIQSARDALGLWANKDTPEIKDKGLLDTYEKLSSSPASYMGNWLWSKLPTSDSIMNAIPSWAKAEPVSPEGKAVARDVSAGLQILPGEGGLAGAATRFMSGFGVNQGADTLADSNAVKGTWAETPVRMAAPLVALKGASALEPITDPGLATARKVARALDSDINARVASGAPDRLNAKVAAMSPDEIDAAKASGNPPSALEMGGKKVRGLLTSATGKSEAAHDAVTDYNDTFVGPNGGIPGSQAETDAQTRVLKSVDGILGGQSVGSYLNDAPKARSIEAKRVYDAAHANPAAASIKMSDLPDEVRNSPAFQNAVEGVKKDIRSSSIAYGYDPKDISVPAEGTPTLWKAVPGKQGVQAFPGTPEQGGNLQFWDMVKRKLWDNATDAKRSNDTGSMIQANQARNDLVNHLDSVVPEYGTARDRFSEMVGESNAAEAGYKFGSQFNSYDDQTRDGIYRSLKTMTPDQQALARKGFASAMREDIASPGGNAKVTQRLLRDPDYAQAAKTLLGGDTYDNLRGNMIREAVRSSASAKVPVMSSPEASHPLRNAGIGAALGPAIEMGSQFLMHSSLLGLDGTGMAALGAAGGAGATGIAMARKAMAERAANRIVPMIMDPANGARVSKLVDADPNFAQLVGALTAGQAVAGPAIREDRAGHAKGGRAIKDHKSEAAALVNMVDRIRKQQAGHTEALLNEDDTTVAKALALANRHI